MKTMDIFYQLLRIRAVETEIARRYSEQEMRCPVHLSVGQEGSAVGVAAAIEPTDYMVSTHRGHAHYLAKGGSLKALLAELYGKKAGCSKGQGGSMHLVDWSCGFVASTSIVGGTIPVGVGTAFASSLKNEKRISVVCIGDAAVEEGVFHESANFAALHHLPVLFACENNFYSCYTHLSERQPPRNLVDMARGHHLTTLSVDGNNPYSIRDELTPILAQMREGRVGPVFLEMITYRTLEHCGPNGDDHLNYRKAEEISFWKEKDPVTVCRRYLQARSEWSEKKEGAYFEKIDQEVKEAFAFAKDTPFPEPSELGAYVYSH